MHPDTRWDRPSGDSPVANRSVSAGIPHRDAFAGECSATCRGRFLREGSWMVPCGLGWCSMNRRPKSFGSCWCLWELFGTDCGIDGDYREGYQDDYAEHSDGPPLQPLGEVVAVSRDKYRGELTVPAMPGPSPFVNPESGTSNSRCARQRRSDQQRRGGRDLAELVPGAAQRRRWRSSG